MYLYGISTVSFLSSVPFRTTQVKNPKQRDPSFTFASDGILFKDISLNFLMYLNPFFPDTFESP